MLATDSGQLTLELVASLIKPIASIKKANRPSPKRQFVVVHKGRPNGVASLENVIEWFNLYGQTEVCQNRERFSIDSQFDAECITAAAVQVGDKIHTQYDSRGVMQVLEIVGRGETDILFRLQSKGSPPHEEFYHKLWRFNLIEPAPDRPITTLQEF
jgi:hypothetical protein